MSWKNVLLLVLPAREAKEAALAYIKGLISPVERKNSWQLAEAIGDKDPYRFLILLNRASWDADAVRDDLRDYVVKHLGDDNAVLIVDETGFLKKGNQSVGVQRQYSGTAGRTENCQVGVFLVYASSHGHTFIDRELYLPKSWTNDRERCERAGVPEEVEFSTKLLIARKMLLRAIDAGVPARWVCADALYGTDHRLRQFIEARGLHYVLAVSRDQTIWVGKSQHRVDAIIRKIEESAWQTLSAGNGSRGERLYQWAASTFEHPKNPQLQRFVLARRKLENPTEITYYLVSAPNWYLFTRNSSGCRRTLDD